MAEILFYHLTESKLEDALPPLLEKSVERGWSVAVQTAGAERRDALDTHLWTYRDDSFLPHGTDAGEDAGRQPVLLSVVPDNINGATVRFIIDGAEPPAALDAYLAKVRGRAHTVTDADVAAALAAGLAEDAIFEQTVGAAIGAGLRRWDIARELIGE